MMKIYIKDFVLAVLSNLPLMAALFSMFFTQFIKVLFYYAVEKEINIQRFFEAGGMPSSHSAMVCSLATMIGLTAGWSSTWFAIATVFSIIVMYDAAGVRRAAGKQALILNRIVEDIYTKGKISKERLKELMGHTPLEVFIGAVLGIINSIVIYLFIY